MKRTSVCDLNSGEKMMLIRFKNRVVYGACLILLCIFSIDIEAATVKNEYVLSGKTMGTVYNITVVSMDPVDCNVLKARIDERLRQINMSMSTYNKDSEISRFNSLEKTGVKFGVSADFLNVMRVSQRLFQLSEGAWDPTVNPLVELWGFRKKRIEPKIPDRFEIEKTLSKIGFQNIKVSEKGFLLKNMASVELDLASIAKGYGVDQISELLEKDGFEDFLVEIGGEVYAHGRAKTGKNWVVGINTPRKDAAYNEVYKTVSIRNMGFATSGNYRQFFEIDGKRYSHILDPRTGFPVSNTIVSVSVQAQNCTLADGLATAIIVMGTEKGLELVKRLDGVDAIIIEDNNGRLKEYISNSGSNKK